MKYKITFLKDMVISGKTLAKQGQISYTDQQVIKVDEIPYSTKHLERKGIIHVDIQK